MRPLMELLERQECLPQALEYYEQLCALLAEEHRQPDPHTQDVAMYLQLKQIQRSPREMRYWSGAMPPDPASAEPLPFPVRTLSLLPSRPGSIPRDHQLDSGKGWLHIQEARHEK